MLPPVLANYPPNSDLFRWLHDLLNAWDGDINYYTIWFTSDAMPLRNYTILGSHRGQKKVLEMVREAIRCHRRKEPVNLDKMEADLSEAVELMKERSHFSRLDIHEAMPFIGFFVDLLQSVEIYGLELTSSGEEAIAVLRMAYEDGGYSKGNLAMVEDLLEELDQLVDGRLISDVDPNRDIDAGGPSEWINFYPELVPFAVTLHLDIYVQPARSKEERATNQTIISDRELGCQQDNPRNYHPVETERQSPSLNGEDTRAIPALVTDRSDTWSSCACCSEAAT